MSANTLPETSFCRRLSGDAPLETHLLGDSGRELKGTVRTIQERNGANRELNAPAAAPWEYPRSNPVLFVGKALAARMQSLEEKADLATAVVESLEIMEKRLA